MQKFNVGDTIVFGDSADNCKAKSIDITIGKLYVIAGQDGDEQGDLFFIDDAGDKNYSICDSKRYGAAWCKPTKVIF